MDEINDIGNVIANTIDNKGEDKRNFFGILRAQRGATDLYNISGDSLNLLNEAYKSNKKLLMIKVIMKKDLKV